MNVRWNVVKTYQGLSCSTVKSVYCLFLFNLKHLIALLILISAVVIGSVSYAAPKTFNFQARIKKPDGKVLESSSVNFRFTYLDEAGTCVLYSEDFAGVNLPVGGGGLINIALGTGSRVYPAAGAMVLYDVFSNSTGSLNCQSGSVVTPIVTDRRSVVMQFNYSGSSGWQTLAPIKINSVPYAMYSSEALTAANATNLGGVAASAYTKKTDFTTCTGAQVLTFDGTSFSCTTPSGGTVATVTASAPLVSSGGANPNISLVPASGTASGYLSSADWSTFNTKLSSASNLSDLASATTARTNLGLGTAAVLNVAASGDATAGQVVKGDDSRLLNALQSSSSLSGDVTGTISATVVSSVGGKTAANISTSVNETQAATSNNTGSTIVRRNASGDFTAGVINATTLSGTNVSATNTSTQNIYLYDALNINRIIFKAPSAGITNYTLTLPATAGTNGQVLSTNASGDLSWVNAVAGGVTDVTANAPLSSSGGATPAISITKANGTTDGYLASTDWTVFNDKLGTSSTFSGDVSGTSSTTSVDKLKGTALNITAITANNYLRYNGTNWVNANLVSTDITSSLGYTPLNPANSLSGDVTGTVNATVVSSVGGKSSSDVSTSVSDTQAATSSNTVSTIVRRDVSGNFAAGVITATTFSGTNVNTTNVSADNTLTKNIYLYDSGSNNILFKAPATVTSNYTLTLPAAVGTNGQVLSTNASGDLSWVNATAGSVTSVTANAPLSSSGGATPAISISKANGTTDGYLASTDWTTFNDKLGTSSTFSGDVSGTSSTTSVDKIKGTAVSGAATTAGQFLVYNGTTQYVPTVMSGDATMSSSGVLTLVNTIGSSGTSSKVTYDEKGRITAVASQNSSDITTALSYTPVNKAGDTMAGALNMGGNTIYGNSTAGGSLNLESTSHATKGNLILGSTTVGKVGIGTASPSAKLSVNASAATSLDAFSSNLTGTAAGTYRGANIYSGLVVTTAASTVVGARLQSYTDSAQTGASSNIGAEVIATSDHTVNTLKGISTTVTGDGFGFGSIPNITGIDLSISTGSTVTDQNGLKISQVNNGTITNRYGIQISTPTGTGSVTNDYGLYQAASTQKNYFAGDVGIGTTTPDTKLEIYNGDSTVTGDNTWAALWTRQYSATKHAEIVASRKRGSYAVPAEVQSGDILGSLSFRNSSSNEGADVRGIATENHSASAYGAALGFYTIGNTTIIPTEKMRIDQNGYIGIGTTAPGAPLDVKGEIRMTGAISGYAGFKPAVNAGSSVWTLPIADGTNGQVLTTNGSGDLSWANATAGSVTSVGASAPLSSTGGATPTISISQASGAVNGYLTSGDWTTFTNKLSSSLTSGNIFVGDGSNVATGVAMSGDATISDTGILTLTNTIGSSGTSSKVTYDAKGRITAVAAQSSSDITTSLGYTPVNKAGDTMSGSLNLPSNGLVVGTNELVVSGGNVGIGTATPGTSALKVSKTYTDTTAGLKYLVSNALTVNPATNSSKQFVASDVYLSSTGAGNANQLTGIMSDVIHTGAGTLSQGTAGVFNSEAWGGGSATSLKGIYAFGGVQTAPGPTGVTNAYGGYLAAGAYKTGVTNLYGTYSEVLKTGASSSSSSKAYGVYSYVLNSSDSNITDAYAGFFKLDSTSTSVTNGYGIYIDAVAGSSNKYGLYQAGSSDNNYFAGNVGIGTTTPTTKLDVAGSLRLYASVESAAASIDSGVSYAIPDFSRNIRRITLNNNSTISLPDITNLNVDDTFTLTIKLAQDATGGRTVIWSAAGGNSIKWDGSSTPTIASGVNKETIVQFTAIGGTTVWYASIVWKE